MSLCVSCIHFDAIARMNRHCFFSIFNCELWILMHAKWCTYERTWTKKNEHSLSAFSWQNEKKKLHDIDCDANDNRVLAGIHTAEAHTVHQRSFASGHRRHRPMFARIATQWNNAQRRFGFASIEFKEMLNDFNCRSAESRWKRKERKKTTANAYLLCTYFYDCWCYCWLAARNEKMRRQMWTIGWNHLMNKSIRMRCKRKRNSFPLSECTRRQRTLDVSKITRTRKMHAILPNRLVFDYSVRFFRSHWSKLEGKIVKNRSAFV